MYAITGATGNTGSVIATKLLARGKKVRVIGRDARRLQDFVRKGAEAFVADVTDAEALTKAFTGAEAAYAMIPPNPASPDVSGYQERVSDALVAAITKAGVGHVALLSSVGADKPQKIGPVVGLHNLEQKLNSVAGLNALYVRAGYFMQNTSGPDRGDSELRPLGRPVARRFGRCHDRGAGYWRLGRRGIASTQLQRQAGAGASWPARLDLSRKLPL